MESDIQKMKNRHINGLQLKLILIISNVFSGLVSMISMILAKSMNLFPSYITSLEYVVAVLLAFVVFVTSIGTWLGKEKFYFPFVLSLTLDYLSYTYNRYIAFIYGTISSDTAIIKITLASLWLLLVWCYFYIRVYRRRNSHQSNIEH